MNVLRPLGDIIREKREELGMDQRELSQKFGYDSYQSISTWERDQGRPPKHLVPKLCHILGLNVTHIINDYYPDMKDYLNLELAEDHAKITRVEEQIGIAVREQLDIERICQFCVQLQKRHLEYVQGMDFALMEIMECQQIAAKGEIDRECCEKVADKLRRSVDRIRSGQKTSREAIDVRYKLIDYLNALVNTSDRDIDKLKKLNDNIDALLNELAEKYGDIFTEGGRE